MSVPPPLPAPPRRGSSSQRLPLPLSVLPPHLSPEQRLPQALIALFLPLPYVDCLSPRSRGLGASTPVPIVVGEVGSGRAECQEHSARLLALSCPPGTPLGGPLGWDPPASFTPGRTDSAFYCSFGIWVVASLLPPRDVRTDTCVHTLSVKAQRSPAYHSARFSPSAWQMTHGSRCPHPSRIRVDSVVSGCSVPTGSRLPLAGQPEAPVAPCEAQGG